jgi:hypothetical protein
MRVVVSRDPGRGTSGRDIARIRAWAVAIGAVAAIVLAGWHYVTLYTSLTNARDDLLVVRDRLSAVGFEAQQGDIDEARRGLSGADDHLDTASAHFRYDPLIRIAGFIPKVGDQVNATGDLIQIAQLLVEVGDEATSAAQKAIDLRDNRPEGRPLTESLIQALEDADPELQRINVLMDDVVEERRELGDADLFRPLNNARTQIDADLPDLSDAVDQLVRASDLLPGFLGFEGDRRYLVLALNSGELLPGGGLVTATGIVTVSRGVNDSIGFADSNGWLPAAQALGIPYIEPPGPLKRYLLRDFSWNLLVSNWDPDYPTWSQQALEFYELVNGPQQVDGIVAVDLVVLEQLLAVTGPKTLDVPDRGLFEFTPANAVLELERMTRPAYVPAADDRKSIIGDLADVVISDLLQLPAESWATAIRTVRRMGSERHIQVFSFREAEQALLADVGWDGKLIAPDADYLHFNEASVLSTKLNLIIHPEGSLSIDISDLGDVTHELRLRYSNQLDEWAKDKDEDLVLKLMLGGLYGGYLRLFGPHGMSNLSVEVDGAPGNIEDVGVEETAEWFGTMLPVGSGETREVVFRWRTTPPGVSTTRYALDIQKQPGTLGMCLAITVTHAGQPVTDVHMSGGAQHPDGRRCLTSDVRLEARFD